jgi:hypothetical protein
MNTKQMADTAAILALKKELDEERAMLDWKISYDDMFLISVCLKDGRWFVAQAKDGSAFTGYHDTPRAAIREAMEMDQ